MITKLELEERKARDEAAKSDAVADAERRVADKLAAKQRATL